MHIVFVLIQEHAHMFHQYLFLHQRARNKISIGLYQEKEHDSFELKITLGLKKPTKIVIIIV